MKMMKWLTLTFVLLVFSETQAKIRVVVADFSNESDAFYLDSWERSIPDLLKTELSLSNDIVILERDKLDAIFQEQKLALAGFIEDTSIVREVGKLAGAEIIISGSIHKLGKKHRIDVNITRVKTTEVKTEKAESPDSKHLNEMIGLLSNNVLFHITGNGEYKEKVSIAHFPTKYFLLATAGFTTAAIMSSSRYGDYRDKYDSNSDLDKFDTYYDKANNSRKLASVMAGLGTAALFGTLYCWILNNTTDDIEAHSQKTIELNPTMGISPNREVSLSVQIHF